MVGCLGGFCNRKTERAEDGASRTKKININALTNSVYFKFANILKLILNIWNKIYLEDDYFLFA